MSNKFATTTSWMVASLLAATSAFAQDNTPAPTKCRPQKSFEQGHELTQSQMMAAYNAPARIDVRGAWDFYVTGTFIYWEAMQENMELGIATEGSGALIAGATANPGQVINMNVDYKPGFKVGLGMNFDYDNWDAYAEYTWFHGTTNTSSNGLTGGRILAFPGQPGLPSAGTTYSTAAQSWNLKMDFADLMLARSYYVGTKLAFRPFVGARGAWIRQNTSASFTGVSTAGTLATVDRSISWGVGPSVGLDTSWMLGYGLRISGVASADLLYTRYNLSTAQTFANTTGVVTGQFNVNQHHIDYLRPHMNLEMGFGWGSYFDNNNWHIDLAASYGFQAFWDQNMTRHYTNGTAQASSNAPNGNLYVHGLNAQVRLDF
ncbi:MAG TPA: Lpg1974 family pore-forming outer membrane protein [Chlamydiales bacterium]